MKISVIIPAYNHEKYIIEAINSVLTQSYHDFEIIIVNDGSTDSTEQKILSIHDRRIHYVSQENSGAHSAINRGISLSQGEYISILNSDDIYLPKRLEMCLNFLEKNTNYSVVMSTVEGIDRLGMPVRRRVTPKAKEWLDWYIYDLPLFNEDEFYPNAFAKNILLTTSNLFVRRKCFQECGVFKGLRYAHDWDMLLRLSRRYQIHLIKEDLLKYRMHSENTIHERDSGLKVQFEVNWLIVENLKELNANVPFSEIVGLLKDNQYLSFGTMFFLSMMKDQPAFYDLIDFNHPQTIELLQLLQQGVSITAFFALQDQVQDLLTGNAWLKSQRDAWEKTATERERIIIALQVHEQDLRIGNAWLKSQRDAWEKTATERERIIIALQVHEQDLRIGNAWLKSQRDAWEKNAADRERIIVALQARAQDLQTGNDWLASQREAWEKTADERDQGIRDLQAYVQELLAGNSWLVLQCEAWRNFSADQGQAIADQGQAIADQGRIIAALSTRLQDTTDRLTKIQSHWAVRILNRLSGRKWF
jgi:glycosyltransferase involved in cell wall biosynthesis